MIGDVGEHMAPLGSGINKMQMASDTWFKVPYQ
jgi:hypothetical protein